VNQKWWAYRGKPGKSHTNRCRFRRDYRGSPRKPYLLRHLPYFELHVTGFHAREVRMIPVSNRLVETGGFDFKRDTSPEKSVDPIGPVLSVACRSCAMRVVVNDGDPGALNSMPRRIGDDPREISHHGLR